ncbi:hypothetical protein ACFYOV_28435 [Streptomyces sp. NPDC005931]|uniref:hypothetical protein n=1 Tax=Streptomyces sp. NPDC005931 TaxID=3364737 RepID=UPI0036924294
MDNMLTLFAAQDEHTAAGALTAGPEAGPVQLDFGDVDAEDALPAWEALLAGRGMDAVTEEAVPRIIAMDEDGSTLVFEVPQVLVEAVREATPSDIDEAATQWFLAGADEGYVWSSCVAEQVLSALAELANVEATSGRRIYGRLT